jgi:hypothetical protein
MNFIGIDNGVTGSIGIISDVNNTHAFIATPIREVFNYTKEPSKLKRIDWEQLMENLPKHESIALLERPMVNPRAFSATQSALRALESTIICLEYLNIPFSYVDSKEWQREFIGSGIIGHDDMKKASMEIGLDLFPSNGMFIKKHKDADGLLIAEFLRRKHQKK